MPTGLEYGARQAQEQAQQAQPLPQVSRVAAAPPTAQPTGPLPGSLGPLDAPTARPNEPVTAGLPMGAGPGPEVLAGGGDTTLDELRAAYQLHPNEELREDIATIEAEGRG